MASASYCEDLTCSICLTIFTDPVNLPCGHSFCRGCITEALSSQQQCPQCRTAVPAEVACLPTSHILKSLAEKAKEAEMIKKEQGGRQKAEVAELCLEHEEKLKLFCVTDQQLACIICRDGERHEGHKFKPIKEAAASLRKELEKGLEDLRGDITATESLTNAQREEITTTKEKSQQLMTQIHRQFDEMHTFLRKREDEIKNQLKYKEEDAVEKMSKSLNAIETDLCESRELEGKLTSVLKVEDSERFLKSWTEGKRRVSPEGLFKPRVDDLKIVKASLSLGPYESHLQFFMWKEMLQVIQPRAELLSLYSNSVDITVSDDGQRLFCSPKSDHTPPSSPSSSCFSYSSSSDHAFSVNEFTSGSPPTIDDLFASDTASDQAADLNFGSTGLDQTMTFSETDPEEDVDIFFSSSSSSNHAFSVNEFTSGQHYWEIDVGQRDNWELGIKYNYLKYDTEKYSTCSPNVSTELEYEDRPRKIGIYLNCTSQKLSFYNADNMTHIHTLSCGLKSKPLSAYVGIRSDKTADRNPLTVCWY